jgi:translocation and assembly module TamB
MKRVLRKFARVIGTMIGVVLLVGCALFIWVARTESGLQFVWQRIAPQLPEGIEVAALEGRLLGPLELRGVTWRTATLEVRIAHAELEWRALSLLASSLAIDGLRVRGVDVVQLPPAGEPAAPADASPLPERIELPFDVEIANASLEELSYRSSPEAEAVLIARADLAGRLDNEEWLLRELAVRGPLFDATARFKIEPHDVYATEGQVDWVFRPPDNPEVAGSTRFSGSLQALDIEQRIAAPYNASADVHVRQPLTALRLDGELTLNVQPTELGIALPNATVNSNVSFEGTLEQLAIVGRVELAHPGSVAALQASGDVNLAEGFALDLRGTFAGLRWPLQDAPLLTSDAGSVELRGTLDDFALALDGNLTMSDGTQGHVRLGGTGNSEALDLQSIEIEALRGTVVGRGNVSWRPMIAAAVELTGTELDPGVLVREWPGRLGATVRADALVDGPDLTVRVANLKIDGRLRDRTIGVTAEGDYSTHGDHSSDTLRLATLSLQSGATQIDASGTAGRELALRWHIESPDLADLSPSFAGHLTANGELNGPRMRPRVTVDAQGQALRFADSEASEVRLTADIDMAGQAPSQLELALRAAEVQGTYIERLQVSGGGNAARHELALAATSDLGEAQVGLVGQVARPWQKDFVWSFELDTATLAHKDFPPWQLREPSTGRISAAHAEVARTCWQSGAADLCVEGARQKDRTAASFSLSELPFGYFAAVLVDPVRVEGDMSVEGTFEEPSGGLPQLNVQLTSSLGRIVSADSNAVEPYALAFGPLEGRVTMADDRMQGELSLPFEGHGQLELEARVGASAGASFAQRPLEGSLEVEVDELDFVANVVSALQDTAGTLGGDMQVSGTIGEPRMTGQLVLDEGKATVRATNVVLEDLELKLASDGSDAIAVEAQGRSGGGSLEAQGSLTLGEAGPEGRITVKGDGFEVVDTPDAQVLVSPDLALALEPDRLALTGSVTVPRARLTPREAKRTVVVASPDQVILDTEEQNARAFTRPLHADVKLVLGDQVQLQGYGLTGRLGGDLTIVEVPGEPITASGELRVVEKGVYEAYGQKLDVRTGRLLFSGGPIEQPGLDVEAVRRPAEGILVGARVRGTLKSPALTVFSEPTMPQQEQLSYLVLGRPLQSASASESSAMSRAALALGLKGGNFVSERVNENLGLDEFGIQTDPGESATEASFVIGKYLSPSLYVSYGIGLFEPVNTLKLKYTISQRWQLVTESSSEASSGDVIYNIERK